MGKAKDVLPEFIKNHHIGGVVTDFSPLRIPSAWVTELSALLPKDVPFCQVLSFCVCMCHYQQYDAMAFNSINTVIILNAAV